MLNYTKNGNSKLIKVEMETPTLANYFMGFFLSALGADLDGLHNKRFALNDAISF